MHAWVTKRRWSMVKNPSPDPPFISHSAIIQGELGLFLTFSVFELQRGYLYGRISPESDWCWFKLLREYMDLCRAVSHARECPHSGTRYLLTFTYKLTSQNMKTNSPKIWRHLHPKKEDNITQQAQIYGWIWIQEVIRLEVHLISDVAY